MDWEIYDGHSTRGAMPEAAVYDAIRNGLPRNAQVRPLGAPQWMPLDAHPPFAAALQQRESMAGYGPPPPAPGYGPPPYAMTAAAYGPAVAPPYGMPSSHAGQMARRERKGEFVGVGCLVQGLGLALPFGGCFVASVPGGIVGAVIGLVLLLVGGRMALKWVCSACKNPIAHRSVQMCPTCHARLT